MCGAKIAVAVGGIGAALSVVEGVGQPFGWYLKRWTSQPSPSILSFMYRSLP
jgi:hypothetical protein